MKGTKLRKSCDDVFPDGHMLNSKTDRRRFLDLKFQGILARHWRSNSAAGTENLFPHKISSQSFRFPNKHFPHVQEGDTKKKQLDNYRVAALKRDVAELQARFKYEQAKKRILKKALQKASSIPSLEDLTPETMQDLVEEIAMLELEVTNLEQHLLELYRQAFNQCSESSAYDCKSLKSNASESTGAGPFQNQPFTGNWQDIHQRTPLWVREESQHHMSAHNSSEKAWTMQYSNSQPISFPQNSFDNRDQGTPYRDNLSINNGQRPLAEKTSATAANRLSEDLVRCMAALYCRLAQPPVPQQEPRISLSSSCSASPFSAQRLSSDGWSAQCRIDKSYEGSCADLSKRNYSTETTSAFEVQWIYIDDDRLADAATMLRNFQSLVQKLECVDPGKMNHEQKLAFWINVHNTLVMHAYLAYGIPRNHFKRASLLQKAAYRVGAHTISAQTIEQSILKCRPNRPAKWLHSILSPVAGAGGGGGKLRGEERKEYAIQYPEPLVCFALCCGARSDPAVRVYTHKLIYLQLEVAKQEFLHAHVNVPRDGKVCLPRILQSFAKESSMKPSQLLEWISNHMEGETAAFIAVWAKDKAHRYIEWLQYDFTFQYMFACPFAI